MDLSLIPDLTMRGAPSPYALPPARTVGRLAALVRDLAARPDRWWHLVRFDGVPVPLDGGLWLSAWPPGRRRALTADVLIVLAGELARPGAGPVRAGRVHVHGRSHGQSHGGRRPRELANPGPGFAITAHTGPRPAPLRT